METEDYDFYRYGMGLIRQVYNTKSTGQFLSPKLLLPLWKTAWINSANVKHFRENEGFGPSEAQLVHCQSFCLPCFTLTPWLPPSRGPSFVHKHFLWAWIQWPSCQNLTGHSSREHDSCNAFPMPRHSYPAKHMWGSRAFVPKTTLMNLQRQGKVRGGKN